MSSFEAEIRQYFVSQQIAFEDHCTSLRLLDFRFNDPQTKTQFSFDAKEKRQQYNLKNWPPTSIPQSYLFIIDDLAARKILAFAPNSGLAVRDNLQRSYYFFSVVDLYLMPKTRVNRTIKKEIETQKGKWLIDLRHGQRCGNLPELFKAMTAYLAQRRAIFGEILECYGHYPGEAVGSGGIIRRPGHWDIDVSGTR